MHPAHSSLLALAIVSVFAGCTQTVEPSEPAIESIVPPPRGQITAANGETKWFAIDTLTLGAHDPQAWRGLGFDLDARNTKVEDSPTSARSCKRVKGSPSKVLEDGTGGIDNNFGHQAVAVLKSLSSDFETVTARDLEGGRYTLLLRLDQVGPENNLHVPGAIYLANGLGAKPSFDARDHFPVVSIDHPLATFPDGYMVEGTWVSGVGQGTMIVPFTFSSAVAHLPVDSGLLSVRVADGSHGTLAGVTPVAKLKSAGHITMEALGVCESNATTDQIMSTFTQAADLVSGAPGFQDENRECDAVSVGIGFTMKPTGVPVVAAEPEPKPKSECDGPTTGG